MTEQKRKLISGFIIFTGAFLCLIVVVKGILFYIKVNNDYGKMKTSDTITTSSAANNTEIAISREPKPIDYSPQSLQNALNDILQAKELFFTDQSTYTDSGCVVLGNVKGTIRNEISNITVDSSYGKESDFDKCKELKLAPDYYEAFFTADKLIYKKNKGSEFVSMQQNNIDKSIIGPKTYIKSILSNFSEAAITRSVSQGSDIAVTTIINNDQLIANCAIILNADKNQISQISYAVEFSDGVAVTGNLTFTDKTENIELPSYK